MTGAQRHAEIAGRGTAVVLLHAGICDGRMWDPQFQALARDHRVLRIDFGGFGRSPLEPGELCHGADVLAAMNRHEIERATLVGASMGGAVAIDVALAQPQRVAALVLCAAAVPGITPSPELDAAWEAEDEALETGDVERAVSDAVRFWVDGPGRSEGSAPADVRALVAQMYARAIELQLPLDGQVEERELSANARARLAELAMPALVIDGEHDVSDFRVIAERLGSQLPRATRATLAAAHLPSMEQPAAFEELLLAFLLEHAA